MRDSIMALNIVQLKLLQAKLIIACEPGVPDQVGPEAEAEGPMVEAGSEG